MRPNIQCDAPSCWCNGDWRERWIPSMDVLYDVQELSKEQALSLPDNRPISDNTRVFRYVYIERATA